MKFSTFLAIFIIAVAIGAVTTTSMGLIQQADAGFTIPHHGCDLGSNGFDHSEGKCFHRD